jgi:hypothetical protein
VEIYIRYSNPKQMAIKANTSLISNSSLYFADSVLTKKIPLNAFTLFDLSSLSEAILFANNLASLPFGSGLNSQIATNLENEGILHRVQISEKKDEIIDEIKEFQYTLDDNTKTGLGEIISDIFHVREDIISDTIIGFNSKHFSQNIKEFFIEGSLTADGKPMDYFKTTTSQEVIVSFPIVMSRILVSTESIMEAYIRALVYFKIAVILDLNYQPDSVRVPIVAYLNKIMLKNINRFGSQLIRKADSNLRKELELIDTNHFTINVPSALSMIIKSCIESNYSKVKFLDKALELRNSKRLKNFRNWLTELESAMNTDIKKYKRMKKTANTVLKSKQYDGDELVSGTTLTIGVSGPSISGIPIAKILHMSAQSLRYHFSLNKGRLIFLHDLSTDLNLAVKDNEIKQFLGKLSLRDIKMFRKLGAYHHDYLKEILRA